MTKSNRLDIEARHSILLIQLYIFSPEASTESSDSKDSQVHTWIMIKSTVIAHFPFHLVRSSSKCHRSKNSTSPLPLLNPDSRSLHQACSPTIKHLSKDPPNAGLLDRCSHLLTSSRTGCKALTTIPCGEINLAIDISRMQTPSHLSTVFLLFVKRVQSMTAACAPDERMVTCE